MTTAAALAIRTAIDTTRLVNVARYGWTVDTYDDARRAWVQGVTLDYHKARAAYAECRVFNAALAMGMDRYDASYEMDRYARARGDWRAYVRDMIRRNA